MADRQFLRATIATYDSNFVAVIEGQPGEWIVFTVSPQVMWSPELKAEVIRLDPGGSWVWDAWRAPWGGRYSQPRSDAMEFYALPVPAPTLQDAILQTQAWLRNFSSNDTVVSLIWEGVVFTHREGLEYEVHPERPYDPVACLKRLKSSVLVRRARYNNYRLLVRLVLGDKTLQDVCQVLANSIP